MLCPTLRNLTQVRSRGSALLAPTSRLTLMNPIRSNACVPLRRVTGTLPCATLSTAVPRVRRSLLYVPGSSDKMLVKSRKLEADTIVFDLEDSVAEHRKGAAQRMVFDALQV